MSVRAGPHLSPGMQRARPVPAASQGALLRGLRAPESYAALTLGLLYLATAVWAYYARQVWATDAVSRTANAMYAVFSRDPHLGAIGFVWLPAPSVLQLPLVLLLNPFTTPVFAGNLFSVLAATATVWVLWRVLEQNGVPRGWTAALVLVYALNPMTVYYAIVGMSESFFILSVLVVLWQFTTWTRERTGQSLFIAGGAVAAGVWTRYEALPFMIAVALAFSLYESSRHDEGETGSRIGAVLFTVLSPGVLSLLLWVFFNLIIMGEAFYFVTSPYGPMAQLRLALQTSNPEVAAASKSLMLAAEFGLTRILLLSPLFLPITAVVTLRGLRRWDWRTLGVVGMGSTLLLFSVYQLGTGGSFGWLRFFMYCQPFTIVFGVVAVADLRRSWRQWAYGGLVIAMLVALPTSAWALWRTDIAYEESGPVRHMVDPSYIDYYTQSRLVTEEIARYIDALPPGKLVYVETAQSWGVAVQVQNRKRLVITNDSDAGVYLKDARRRLDYILVPPAGGLSSNGELATQFPGIWDGSIPWLVLDHEWHQTEDDVFRLYRVAK